MKRCPQCQSVFDDALVYCTNDGTPLVSENFVLPSEASAPDDEEETVIHRNPIQVEVPPTEAPTEQFSYEPPPTVAAAPIVVERPRNTFKYLIFLTIGLLLGGSLVLATLLLARVFYREPSTTEPVANAERSPRTNSTPNAKETPAETPPTASEKHRTPTDADPEEFNGRVIAVNAYVRFLPSRESAEVDVLPVNDRLDISDRANENSPWFYVTCEHGTSGWMHGNTIEYLR